MDMLFMFFNEEVLWGFGFWGFGVRLEYVNKALLRLSGLR